MASILTPCHCAALRKATRKISALYDAALLPVGLKTTQFSLLAAIDRHQAAPLTMRELAEVMVMDRSTLGHNLRPLERSGFIRLKADPDDRRSIRVHLLARGRARLDAARIPWRKVQTQVGAIFQKKPKASLHDSLLAVAAWNFPSSPTTKP